MQPCLAGRILARGRMKPDQVLGFILEGLLSLLLFKQAVVTSIQLTQTPVLVWQCAKNGCQELEYGTWRGDQNCCSQARNAACKTGYENWGDNATSGYKDRYGNTGPRTASTSHVRTTRPWPSCRTHFFFLNTRMLYSYFYQYLSVSDLDLQ